MNVMLIRKVTVSLNRMDFVKASITGSQWGKKSVLALIRTDIMKSNKLLSCERNSSGLILVTRFIFLLYLGKLRNAFVF